MSFDWGIVLGGIGTVSGIAGAIYSYFRYKQIRKEKLMTNIVPDLKYEVKKDNMGNSYFDLEFIFENIGLMNLKILYVLLTFEEFDELNLDYEKIHSGNFYPKGFKKSLNKNEIEYSLYYSYNKSLKLFQELKKGTISEIDCYNECWQQLLGYEIAAEEKIKFKFIVPFKNSGRLNTEIFIESKNLLRKRSEKIIKLSTELRESIHKLDEDLFKKICQEICLDNFKDVFIEEYVKKYDVFQLKERKGADQKRRTFLVFLEDIAK